MIIHIQVKTLEKYGNFIRIDLALIKRSDLLVDEFVGSKIAIYGHPIF